MLEIGSNHEKWAIPYIYKKEEGAHTYTRQNEGWSWVGRQVKKRASTRRMGRIKNVDGEERLIGQTLTKHLAILVKPIHHRRPSGAAGQLCIQMMTSGGLLSVFSAPRREPGFHSQRRCRAGCRFSGDRRASASEDEIIIRVGCTEHSIAAAAGLKSPCRVKDEGLMVYPPRDYTLLFVRSRL